MTDGRIETRAGDRYQWLFHGHACVLSLLPTELFETAQPTTLENFFWNIDTDGNIKIPVAAFWKALMQVCL